jgi:hypothetical protein
MTEAQFLQAVRALAQMRGWMTYHTHRSDRSEPGFPDLVCVHPDTGQFLVAELKTDRGMPTKEQNAWLAALRLSGVAAYLWRPADMRSGEITAALTPNRRPVGAVAR